MNRTLKSLAPVDPLCPVRWFHLPGGRRDDPAVAQWFDTLTEPLGPLARSWFHILRDCGPDVGEQLHDGHPTACVGEWAFASISAFRQHANLNFYFGAVLDDPAGLLRGRGRYMRHVRLLPDTLMDRVPLIALIQSAYRDLHRRLTLR